MFLLIILSLLYGVIIVINNVVGCQRFSRSVLVRLEEWYIRYI